MGIAAMERAFYLEHFRGSSIVIVCAEPDPEGVVDAVRGLLLDCGAQVLVVRGADPHGSSGGVLVPPGGGAIRTVPRIGWAVEDTMSARSAGVRRAAVEVMRALTAHPTADLVGDHGPDELLTAVTELQGLLRPEKLVLLHAGAPDPATRSRAFAVVDGQPGDGPTGDDMGGDHAAGDDRTGDGTAALAERCARAALAEGVQSVNLCRVAGLEAELLTYQGSGLLLTRTPYAEVGPLRMDELGQAHRLVSRGMQEGFLKPRSEDEVLALMADGFVARVDHGPPAGFAALVAAPYAADDAAEVTALTTISRFAGGGIGGQLVRTLVEVAGRRGIGRVFACTTSPEAAAFFRALSFAESPLEALPSAKWAGYDAQRRAALAAFVRPTS